MLSHYAQCVSHVSEWVWSRSAQITDVCIEMIDELTLSWDGLTVVFVFFKLYFICSCVFCIYYIIVIFIFSCIYDMSHCGSAQIMAAFQNLPTFVAIMCFIGMFGQDRYGPNGFLGRQFILVLI